MPRAPAQIAAEPLPEVKPNRPAPIKLYDENYQKCGKMVCQTPADAQRSLKNKVEIRNWMGSANAVMDYYEQRESKSGPSL